MTWTSVCFKDCFSFEEKLTGSDHCPNSPWQKLLFVTIWRKNSFDNFDMRLVDDFGTHVGSTAESDSYSTLFPIQSVSPKSYETAKNAKDLTFSYQMKAQVMMINWYDWHSWHSLTLTVSPSMSPSSIVEPISLCSSDRGSQMRNRTWSHDVACETQNCALQPSLLSLVGNMRRWPSSASFFGETAEKGSQR